MDQASFSDCLLCRAHKRSRRAVFCCRPRWGLCKWDRDCDLRREVGAGDRVGRKGCLEPARHLDKPGRWVGVSGPLWCVGVSGPLLQSLAAAWRDRCDLIYLYFLSQVTFWKFLIFWVIKLSIPCWSPLSLLTHLCTALYCRANSPSVFSVIFNGQIILR